MWCNYPHGKIIYDLVDSYLAIPKTSIKGLLRGIAKSVSGQYKNFRLSHWRAIQDMCERSDAVVCTTLEQQIDITPYCKNVSVVHDSFEKVATTIKTDYTSKGPFKIVWEGQPSNVYQIYQLKNVLRKLDRNFDIEFHVVTDLFTYQFLNKYRKVSIASQVRRVFPNAIVHPWDKDKLSQIVCSCDVAVIPIDLKDALTSGKPENKLLLFWEMGMPTITSSTKAYDRAMRAAGTPLSCANDNEWFRVLTNLIENSASRKRMGELGLDCVRTNYNYESRLEQWDKVFQSIGL
jgi:spore maturation protein CgeB